MTININKISQLLSDKGSIVSHKRIKRERISLRKSPSLKSIRKELVARRRLEKRERKEKGILKEVKQRRSVSGRLGTALVKGINVGRTGVTRSLYQREQPRTTAKQPVKRIKGMTRTGGVATGKRGRPAKSYDPRYAKYGGVYGYRKAMAHQRRLERTTALRNAAITPRQQETLRRIEYNKAIQQKSREQSPFHGTSGEVQIGNIMDQINAAANIVQ